MTGREVMEMVDTLDRGSAEIARLRALNAELVAALRELLGDYALLCGDGMTADTEPPVMAAAGRALAKADQC
jgi:hypothetical protein